MNNPKFKYPDTKAYDFVVDRLAKRGVTQSDLAKIVYETQRQYEPDVTLKECEDAVVDVMHKRELMNNAMVMLELDRLTEEGQVDEPLASIIKNDAGVFGVDGTIGTTNFGYFYRVKSGIMKKFDTSDLHVNTFIDDLLSAIVAAVCGKIAHKYA